MQKRKAGGIVELGICSFEISHGSVSGVFSAMKRLGFVQTQFSFASAGLAEMPDEIPDEVVQAVVRAKNQTDIPIVCVNGTYNMLSRDPDVRRQGRHSFEAIAAVCDDLGCELISVCTGTRSTQSMWVPHPDNNLPDAWSDLLLEMELLIQIAERHNVRIGIETEASNVANTPEKTRQLLHQLRSDRLRVIMDCANLFQAGTARPDLVRPTMERAFELLGGDVALAHGKDIKEGPGIEFVSPGSGIIDFGYFAELLNDIGYQNSMMLHGFTDQSHIGPGAAAVAAAVNQPVQS